jgi:hypothetical protein
MRRLTSKDISKRKKTEEEPAPDFYSLSRRSPLSESAPAPVSSTTNLLATSTTATVAQVSGAATTNYTIAAAAVPAPSQGYAQVELALLERRRADILERMNSFTNKGFQQPNNTVPRMVGMQEMVHPVGNLSYPFGLTTNTTTAQSQQHQLQRQMFGAGLMNSNMDISNLLAMGGVPTQAMHQGFSMGGGNPSFNPFQL